MANDCFVQYRTGFRSIRHDLSSEKRCPGAGSKHSVMYLLLSGGYRTGNVWCKFETQLSFHLRYDWFCMCINCLCSYKQYSKCNRCWRSSGNPFHAAAIHVNLCYLYVNCRSSSICINSYGW